MKHLDYNLKDTESSFLKHLLTNGGCFILFLIQSTDMILKMGYL